MFLANFQFLHPPQRFVKETVVEKVFAIRDLSIYNVVSVIKLTDHSYLICLLCAAETSLRFVVCIYGKLIPNFVLCRVTPYM